MSTRLLYIIVAVLILLGVGLYIYNGRQEAPVVNNSPTSTTPPVVPAAPDNDAVATVPLPTPSTPPPTPDAHFSNEEDINPQQIEPWEVTYNGSSFSPANLNILVGDIVVFKNKSEVDFRPASGPHPTHTDYPGFDAKQNIAPGGQFSFKFLKVGTWGYHDHLNSKATGTIVVKP